MAPRTRKIVISLAVAAALAVPVAATRLMSTTQAGQSLRPTGPVRIVYGDGRTSEAHGLRITNIQLPPRARQPGRVSFEILDQAGNPVTSMVRDQTKLMHAFVVSSDYTVFKHVFPRLSDGTWSAGLTLPAGGTYRVIAEFTVSSNTADSGPAGPSPSPSTSGFHRDHVILAGEWDVADSHHAPVSLGPSDQSVNVALDGASGAIDASVLSLRVSTLNDHAVTLSPWLGSVAQVTAFNRLSGMMVRLRPSGKPAHAGEATVVNLESGIRLGGPYVVFVELHTLGKAHTLRIDTIVN